MLLNIAQRRLLPLPAWEQPLTRPTSSLRALTQRAHRLEQVLEDERPFPVSVTMIAMPNNWRLHKTLSATNLGVVHNAVAATMSCINIITGTMTDVVPAGKYILNESGFFASGGMAAWVCQTSASDTNDNTYTM
jgi:hypothetical protein